MDTEERLTIILESPEKNITHMIERAEQAEVMRIREKVMVKVTGAMISMFTRRREKLQKNKKKVL